MKQQLFGAGAILALIAFGTSAQAQIVSNGSFETPNVGTLQYTPSGASWTFGSGAGISRNSGFVVSGAIPDGAQFAFIQVSGGPQSFSQTLNLVSAGSYTLTYSVAGRFNNFGSTFGNTNYTVSLGGTTLSSGTTTTNQGFSQVTENFIAGSGAQTLTFAATNPSPGTDNTAYFDNVSLTFNGPVAAPEPGTLALFAFSLLGTAHLHRIRRK